MDTKLSSVVTWTALALRNQVACEALIVAPRWGGGTEALPTTGAALLALGFVFGAASRWPASRMQRPVMFAAAAVATAATAAWFLSLPGGSTATLAPLLIEAVLAVWLWWLLITDGV